MPPLQLTGLPPAVLDHLAERVAQREITVDQIGILRRWVLSQPHVPIGEWYYRFQGFTICGDGALVSTILKPEQYAKGVEWTPALSARLKLAELTKGYRLGQ